jgi:hypothetical protein
MEHIGKVRITCTNCLHSEILPKHKSDPTGTRLIVTESCTECCADSSGLIQYYDADGQLIEYEGASNRR